MTCQAPQRCLPASLVFHSQLTRWYHAVRVTRWQHLQSPLWAVKPGPLLRAVRHSPQPQGECCRHSPLTQPGLPSHAPPACIPREACSPTWSIQGSGPAHPPTTTLSPSLPPWWDTSSIQGPHPGSSRICRGSSGGPASSCWRGECRTPLCPTCCLGLHPACVLTSAALEEPWVVERRGRLLPQTPGPQALWKFSGYLVLRETEP